MALAVSASAAWSCDRHADAVEAKDAKDAKAVAANGDAKGCSMPCCAKGENRDGREGEPREGGRRDRHLEEQARAGRAAGCTLC